MLSRPSSRVSSTLCTREHDSRKRSNSSHSEGGSHRRHEAAIIFYGPGEDAHRALSLGRQGADQSTVYHVRSDSDRDADQFYFEEVERPLYVEGFTGMSRLSRLSSRERNDASTLLRNYGQDDRNLPRISTGTNCHGFATGGVRVLEDAGFASPGSHVFWDRQHHRRQSAVAADLEREGRPFEATQHVPRTASADYAFGRDTEERRPLGRLDMAAFRHLAVLGPRLRRE